MARTTTRTRIKVRKKGGDAPKPEILTLEEARAKYEPGTLELLLAELGGLESIKDEARELTNKANRQKTKCGKAFTAFSIVRNLEPGAEVHINGTAYSHDYATSEGIPAEDLYALVTKKQITLEQFLKSVSVVKEAAKRNLGDHILVRVAKPKKGNKLDIRARDLDKPVPTPLVIPHPNKPAPSGKLNRENEDKPSVGTKVSKVRRTRRIRAR